MINIYIVGFIKIYDILKKSLLQTYTHTYPGVKYKCIINNNAETTFAHVTRSLLKG